MEYYGKRFYRKTKFHPMVVVDYFDRNRSTANLGHLQADNYETTFWNKANVRFGPHCICTICFRFYFYVRVYAA